MVVIHLSPAGRKKAKVFKVLVAKKGHKLTGKYIEKIGTYTPGRDANGVDQLILKQDRFDFWLKQGAQPSPTLLKVVKFGALSDADKKKALDKDKAFRKKRAEKAAKAPAEGEAAAPAAG